MNSCGHPGCQIKPIRPSECVLLKPLLLYVPPDGHAHLSCPEHPDGHVIMGSGVTL